MLKSHRHIVYVCTAKFREMPRMCITHNNTVDVSFEITYLQSTYRHLEHFINSRCTGLHSVNEPHEMGIDSIVHIGPGHDVPTWLIHFNYSNSHDASLFQAHQVLCPCLMSMSLCKSICIDKELLRTGWC